MKKLHKITLETENDFAKLMPFSDIHYGNKNHDGMRFKLYLDTPKKDGTTYVIGVGDWIENAGKNNLGYHDQIVPIDKQVDYIVKKFMPIADDNRLIGFIRGNHEIRSVRGDAGRDIAEEISRRLGVTYMEDGAFISFNIKKRNHKKGKNYTAYAIHGSTNARTKSGKIRACEQLATFVYADLYMTGHVHALAASNDFKYIILPNSIREREPTFVLTGHYLEYIGSYAQQKALKPSGPAGTPKIKFHTNMRRISVSL